MGGAGAGTKRILNMTKSLLFLFYYYFKFHVYDGRKTDGKNDFRWLRPLFRIIPFPSVFGSIFFFFCWISSSFCFTYFVGAHEVGLCHSVSLSQVPKNLFTFPSLFFESYIKYLLYILYSFFSYTLISI